MVLEFAFNGNYRDLTLPSSPLNSDPACIVLCSLTSSAFLGIVQRLGSIGAARLLPQAKTNRAPS